MPNKFSEITKMIQKKLPYWMKKPRTDPDSIGAQFLNVFGLALEDIQYIVDYAYKQMYIDKADLNQIDCVYKAFVPAGITTEHSITVTTDSFMLLPCPTLEEFMMALDTDSVYSEIRFPNPFMIDYEKHVIYVRVPYDKSDQYPDGRVRITIRDGSSSVVFDTVIKLEYHPVWNFFDELGLLVCCQRIPRESNARFKERILDVFKHPGGAHGTGLLNGIARELGLRIERTWEDGSEDYPILEPMVVVNTIEVDGELVSPLDIYYNTSGQIVIKGNSVWAGLRRHISYIVGIEMHALHDKNDFILQAQIDTPGKPMLQYIMERINSKAPIMWNHFIWDEAFWDVASDITGHTPALMDAVFTQPKHLTKPQLRATPQVATVKAGTGVILRLYRASDEGVSIDEIITDTNQVTLPKGSVLKFK